jgi:hypothetical protein
MSQQTVTSPTPVPALRDQVEDLDRVDQDDPPAKPAAKPSKMWALLEALSYAGVFIDPTGAIMAQRLRNARIEEQRRAREG